MLIRLYEDYVPWLDHALQERGWSWTTLAKAVNRGEAWGRKIRSGATPLSISNAEAIAEALNLSDPDRAYLGALARTRSTDLHERADAWGSVWADGDPTLSAPVPGPHESWLQEQSLTTWLVMHTAQQLGPNANASRVARRLRTRLHEADVRAALEDLGQRGLLDPDASSPHRQPTSRRIAAQVAHLTGYAQRARWRRDIKHSEGFTAAVTDEQVSTLVKLFGRMSARFRGLGAAGGDETVLTQVGFVPLTGAMPVDPTRQTQTGEANTPASPPARAVEQGSPWDNPLEVSWQDVARLRMDELKVNQAQMSLAVGKSRGWTSKVLAYLQDVHNTDDPQMFDKLCAFLRFDDVNRRAEFRHLVNATHPDRSVRQRAKAALQAIRGLSALTTEPGERRIGVERWYDTAMDELALVGALPRDPKTFAHLFVPPIPLDDAVEVFQRWAAKRRSYVKVDPEPSVEHRADHSLMHVEWLDVLEDHLHSPSAPMPYLSTQILSAPAGAYQHALLVLKEAFANAAAATTPAQEGDVTLFHVRVNLLLVAD